MMYNNIGLVLVGSSAIFVLAHALFLLISLLADSEH